MELPQGSLFDFVFYTVVNLKLKGGSPKDWLWSRTAIRFCSLKLTWDRSEKICQVHKYANIGIIGTVVCNLKKNEQIKVNKIIIKKILIKTIVIAYNYIKHNYTQTYTNILHYITM